MGSNVLAMCQEFYKQCTFSRSLNATFLSLLSHKHKVDDLKRFLAYKLSGQYVQDYC